MIGLGASCMIGDGGPRTTDPKAAPAGETDRASRAFAVSESLPRSPEHNVLDRRLALDTINLVTLPGLRS